MDMNGRRSSIAMAAHGAAGAGAPGSRRDSNCSDLPRQLHRNGSHTPAGSAAPTVSAPGSRMHLRAGGRSNSLLAGGAAAMAGGPLPQIPSVISLPVGAQKKALQHYLDYG
eukprot:tig00000455_g1031.t1